MLDVVKLQEACPIHGEIEVRVLLSYSMWKMTTLSLGEK